MIVNICISIKDTKCVTLAVSVCKDGTKLTPMMIFGKTQNRIVAQMFPTFPTSGKYNCQEDVWMNNSTRKYHFTACVVFIQMTHDAIAGRFYSTGQLQKLSTSLVEMSHFASLLMLELTGN